MTTATLRTTVKPATESTTRMTLARLVALHLLPGLAIVATYAIIAWLVRPLNWPSLLPFVLSIPVALLPVELGFLLHQGKRIHGRYTLQDVIAYNQPLAFREYVVWVPLTLLASIALFMAFGVMDGILLQRIFFWWPVWMNPDYASLIGQPSRLFWATVVLLMVFGNIVGPAVEELYFRGYLLPRMQHLGRWGVVLNGTLFAVYHFWSPWYVISRAVGVLPMVFAARHKRNVMVPILVHCTLNTVGTLLSLASVL